jgi:hypothetical protein
MPATAKAMMLKIYDFCVERKWLMLPVARLV